MGEGLVFSFEEERELEQLHWLSELPRPEKVGPLCLVTAEMLAFEPVAVAHIFAAEIVVAQLSS